MRHKEQASQEQCTFTITKCYKSGETHLSHGSTSATFSGGPALKIPSVNGPSSLGMGVFLTPSKQMPVKYLTLGHNHFHLHSLQLPFTKYPSIKYYRA